MGKQISVKGTKKTKAALIKYVADVRQAVQTASAKVAIVEFRRNMPIQYLSNHFTSDIAHVASSLEKAVEWCRRHLDLAEKDNCGIKGYWWFAILEQPLDAEPPNSKTLSTAVDWNGVDTLGLQPVGGYNDEYERALAERLREAGNAGSPAGMSQPNR